MLEGKNLNARGSVNLNNSTTNIWQDILKESITKKDLEESNIFIFGDKFSGKRSLIKYLNKELLHKNEFEEQQKRDLGNDDIGSKYSLVDYTFIGVKKYTEYDSESIGKINIWLANELIDKDLFQTVIKPENIVNSVCMITVDLSRPWEIIESLKKWTNFIYDTFSSLMLKLPFDKQEEMREKVVEYLKLYEEPQFEEDEKTLKKEILSEESKSLKLELPLKEGVLKINCGIPIVFVINKSDVVLSNDHRKKFEEDSEFIIKHIRNLAIGYGASIVYTSPKRAINLNVLYEYIVHRIYKFDLIHKPNTLDKDSYFIPSGFDSLTLLRGFDISNDLQKIYEERIPTPKQKNIVKEQEVICEDMSFFLNAWRDNKKAMYQSNTEYSSNPGSNSIDDKGKKKLDLLQGIRKQDYGSTSNANVNGNTAYESTDGKSKVDFQKFLGMNANKTASVTDSYASNYQRSSNINPSSALNSLKTKNPENIKDNIKKSVEEKLKALGDRKDDVKLRLTNLKKKE